MIANAEVALLAEGVDRNNSNKVTVADSYASPSSRRAWIEIVLRRSLSSVGLVALLAEGVDRNGYKVLLPPQA